MQHSIVAPSSAGQWVNCPASVRAQSNIKETDHPHRAEGEALHNVAHGSLTGTPAATGDTINGIILTQEMLDRVGQYITYIKSIVGAEPHFEERVTCCGIHPDCFGTPDYWEYDTVTNTLTIADYKDGYLEVSPVENWQLMTYASGIIDTLPPGAENTLKIRFVIVQPRSYGETLKIWNAYGTTIRGHINSLNHSAAQALGADPMEKPGEHCHYCSAMFLCSANMNTVNNLSNVAVFTPEAPENDISTELAFLEYVEKMVKYRKAAVEARAFQAIKNGETVQGYTTGTGRGKLAWRPDTTGLDDVAALMGIPVTKTINITPTQAKDAGIPAEMLKPFTVYNAGKMILKPVNTKKAQEIFGQ